MTDRIVSVPTTYGPVDVDLTECNGPDCNAIGQTKYMVGWFHLEPRGIDAPTLGYNTADPMDFCSMLCLKKALDIIVR
mgnify:CR=1 FL=1